MTPSQSDKLIALSYIDIEGDYDLSIAINEMYYKKYLYECDYPELFSPKPHMLTDIGLVVLKRLYMIRDLFGITPNFEILKELFLKAKQEYGTAPKQSPEKLLIQAKIDIEVKFERYEVAEKLKKELANY